MFLCWYKLKGMGKELGFWINGGKEIKSTKGLGKEERG
jgi:hypothetical protein